MRAMSRSTFDLHTYIQITYVGEEAVDDMQAEKKQLMGSGENVAESTPQGIVSFFSFSC